ncbi:MAG: hypothetical protein JST54_03240 [Deltaproteobacteria bacterium]|nr:hypothetical protein [Deltaproteobacteria bacterium]
MSSETPRPQNPGEPEPASTPAVETPAPNVVANVVAPEPAAPVAPAIAPAPDKLQRAMWWIFAIGTVVRVVFVLTVHRPIDFDYSDMHSYIDRAREMATPGQYPSIYDWYYPSGSAFFIHLWLRLFGMKIGWLAAGVAQALYSSAEIPLIYFATKRFFSKPVAFGAALLFATHYLSIGYAGFFMSENYLAIGLIGACALFVPEKPLRLLGAGLLLGLAAWAKSQAVLLAPMWSLVLWRRGQRLSAVLLTAGTLAVVVPISIYVSVLNHQPTFISYNGGQTFALAHCPIREISYNDPVGHTGAMFTLPVQNQRFERGDVEASWGNAAYHEPFVHSNFYMREGFKCIQRYPLHYLRMIFYHVADTFCGPPWSITMPWPDSHTHFRYFSLVSNLFVCLVCFPLALWGLKQRWREMAMWVYFVLPLSSVLITAVLFHGDSRFRCPYDFGIFIAACAAIEVWWKRRHASGPPPTAATPSA